MSGSGRFVGKTVEELRSLFRSDVELRAFTEGTADEPGPIDAHTNRCIVSFDMKPGKAGKPIVWRIQGFGKNHFILDDDQAAACAASLQEASSSNELPSS
jgi:hypothetical protein